MIAAKNINKGVESAIEDMRNFDKQVDSSWSPTIKIEKVSISYWNITFDTRD